MICACLQKACLHLAAYTAVLGSIRFPVAKNFKRIFGPVFRDPQAGKYECIPFLLQMQYITLLIRNNLHPPIQRGSMILLNKEERLNTLNLGSRTGLWMPASMAFRSS